MRRPAASDIVLKALDASEGYQPKYSPAGSKFGRREGDLTYEG